MKKLIGLLVLVMLAGCNGTGVKSRLKSLDDSINAYAQALRWGRYEDAQVFHMGRDGRRIVLDEHTMKDIRVTGYSVRETVLDEEGTTAEVQAEFKYFITNRGALQTKVVPQTWWHDDESKRWLLDSGLPDFKGMAATKGDAKQEQDPRIREIPRE
jgi:hypothetical protein